MGGGWHRPGLLCGEDLASRSGTERGSVIFPLLPLQPARAREPTDAGAALLEEWARLQGAWATGRGATDRPRTGEWFILCNVSPVSTPMLLLTNRSTAQGKCERTHTAASWHVFDIIL